MTNRIVYIRSVQYSILIYKDITTWLPKSSLFISAHDCILHIPPLFFSLSLSLPACMLCMYMYAVCVRMCVICVHMCYACAYVLCMFMCAMCLHVCYVCAGAKRGWKRPSDHAELVLQAIVRPWHGSWELNQGPLEEQENFIAGLSAFIFPFLLFDKNKYFSGWVLLD